MTRGMATLPEPLRQAIVAQVALLAPEHTDPAIGAQLGISAHQVWRLRTAAGIPGQKPGRPRKDDTL